MSAAALEPLLVSLLTRFVRQNGANERADDIKGMAARLAAMVVEYGHPGPVRSEAESVSSRLSDVELTNRASRAAGPDASSLLVDAARQLVKALFYPELQTCRNSYSALTADGRCKRQELERVRMRVCGTHCVDCPHWQLSPDEHAAFLGQAWVNGGESFARDQYIYLPEDFRALRAALRALGE